MGGQTVVPCREKKNYASGHLLVAYCMLRETKTGPWPIINMRDIFFFLFLIRTLRIKTASGLFGLLFSRTHIKAIWDFFLLNLLGKPKKKPRELMQWTPGVSCVHENAMRIMREEPERAK